MHFAYQASTIQFKLHYQIAYLIIQHSVFEASNCQLALDTIMPPRPVSNRAPAQKQTKSRVKKAPANKKPLSVNERLKRLFTSLCAQIDGGHFKNAIKTCDKSLSSYNFLVG